MLSPRSIDYWYYQDQIIHLLPIGNVYIFTEKSSVDIRKCKKTIFSSKIPRRNVVKMDKLTTIISNTTTVDNGNCSIRWLVVEQHGGSGYLIRLLVFTAVFPKKKEQSWSDEIHPQPPHGAASFLLNSFRNHILLSTDIVGTKPFIHWHSWFHDITHIRKYSRHKMCLKLPFFCCFRKGPSGLKASIITLKLS